MAELLKGKPVADAISEQLMSRVATLKGRGVVPTLAILRVGEREDDLSYERGAMKRCEALDIAVRNIVLDAECTQEDLLAAIEQVNADSSIHGCLMFRPLPEHLDEAVACEALDPAKDIDGITSGSLYGVFASKPIRFSLSELPAEVADYGVFSNQAVGFPPCTADACMRLLLHYGFDLNGAKVAVVGRSLVIGKPVSMMLQATNATVTMCHTGTRDLAAACREADILVVAAGHIGTVGADAVREGQVVIDVGINWDEAAGKLVGDVLFDEVEPIVAAITPVPGGVGSVTTAILASHVAEAAERMLA